MTEPSSLTSALLQRVHEAMAEAGGWLPFDRFMAMALYEPGLGYYAHGSRKLCDGAGHGRKCHACGQYYRLNHRLLAAHLHLRHFYPVDPRAYLNLGLI